MESRKSGKYDVLWYYVGGLERGSWKMVSCVPEDFEANEKLLRLAGYFTRRGRRSIGAPEGAPVEMKAGRQTA